MIFCLVSFCWLFRDHSFIMYTQFSEKLTFLTNISCDNQGVRNISFSPIKSKKIETKKTEYTIKMSETKINVI